MSEIPLIVVDSGIPGIVQALEPLGRVRRIPAADVCKEALGDAEVLVVRSVVQIGKELLDTTRVRFVASATAGTDHVDLGYLQENGIGFGHAPGANADSVADYVISALLKLAVRDQVDLAGKILGVVGYGEVGSRVAARARGLGLQVRVCDPPLRRIAALRDHVSLDLLLDEADILSLHVPLTRQGRDRTLHLLDRAGLERFQGWLINTSRGAVVDNGALKATLRAGSGPVRVVVDVWEGEPRPDPELVTMCDIATPHIAGYATDSKWAATEAMRRAVALYLDVELDESAAPLEEISLTAPSIELEGQAWLAALAGSVSQLDRDDQALRTAIASDDPAGRFEAYRSGYPGKRLMRKHRVAPVPSGLEYPVVEGLAMSLGGSVR